MISEFMGKPPEYWLKIEVELKMLKRKTTMTPTNELRFVEREILDNPVLIKTVKILQQKWESYSGVKMHESGVIGYYDYEEEWRDIPVGVE